MWGRIGGGMEMVRETGINIRRDDKEIDGGGSEERG